MKSVFAERIVQFKWSSFTQKKNLKLEVFQFWETRRLENYLIIASATLIPIYFYTNGTTRPLFVYFRSSQKTNLAGKNVIRIRTRIVGVDHWPLDQKLNRHYRYLSTLLALLTIENKDKLEILFFVKNRLNEPFREKTISRCTASLKCPNMQSTNCGVAFCPRQNKATGSNWFSI